MALTYNQVPAVNNIRFVSGDDISIPFQIGTEDENGTFTPYDLTGCAIESRIKFQTGESAATPVVVDAANGVFTVNWNETQTEQIQYGCYDWFVALTDSSGYERTLIYGNAEVLSRYGSEQQNCY